MSKEVLDAIERQCKTIYFVDNWYQLTTMYDDVQWMIILGVVGALFNGVFATIVYREKGLQVHPMRILMLISFLESIYIYLFFMFDYVCQWQYYKFTAYILYPHCYDEE